MVAPRGGMQRLRHTSSSDAGPRTPLPNRAAHINRTAPSAAPAAGVAVTDADADRGRASQGDEGEDDKKGQGQDSFAQESLHFIFLVFLLGPLDQGHSRAARIGNDGEPAIPDLGARLQQDLAAEV